MAKIAYCTPGLGACGGVRVILEHCTRLKKRGHDVTIINPSGNSPQLWEWYGKMDVPVVRMATEPFDLCVATGGSTVYWAKNIPAGKYYYFVQMMEHRFFKENTGAYHQHLESYKMADRLGMNVVTIARWLQSELFDMSVDSVVVGNGVNRDHFYKEGKKEDYILIEGDNRNWAKDVDGVGWEVGEFLRRKYGVKLYGYAAIPHDHVNIFDEFWIKPNVDMMRRLYSGALFLLKASRFEGRACGPVEAMCCGTTTVRGIINGDDDLKHEENCLRTDYNLMHVTEMAERMLERPGLRERLERNGKKYAKRHLDWDKIVDTLEEVYGI